MKPRPNQENDMFLLLKPISLILILFFSIGAGNAAAERLAVSSEIANIRSGPGKNYDVLWQVERFYPIAVIKKKGNWYHFKDFEDDEGWIHKSLVRKFSTVISIKDKCNVRSGPGTTHDILFKVEKGIPFKLLKRKGNWIHVEHADGDKGWIYKTLVW